MTAKVNFAPERTVNSVKSKENILKDFPFFDKGAIDAARFIYGHEAKEIYWHDGELTIDFWYTKHVIVEGERNNTLSRFAGRVLKRFDEAVLSDVIVTCNPRRQQYASQSICCRSNRFAYDKCLRDIQSVELCQAQLSF